MRTKPLIIPDADHLYGEHWTIKHPPVAGVPEHPDLGEVVLTEDSDGNLWYLVYSLKRRGPVTTSCWQHVNPILTPRAWWTARKDRKEDPE